MTEIISITEILIDHKNKAVELFTIFAVVAAFAIGFFEYKNKLLYYITHRRNKWWFVYLILSFATLFLLWIKDFFYVKDLFLLLTLFVLYTFVCIRSLKPKFFSDFKDPILHCYEKKLYRGLVAENIDYFRKDSHWYFFTAEDKLEYQMLRCLYFFELSEFENAFKALALIDPSWLYEEEKIPVKIKKSLCLVFMGDINAALQLLGDPEKWDKQNSMILFVYSMIYESFGDMDKAYSFMERAKDIVDAGVTLPDWERGEVYNNYSRVAYVKGNKEESLRYTNLAWKYVKDSKDMRLIKIMGTNRLIRMATCGRRQAECEAALKEYEQCIPVNSIENQIEINNAAILLYKQLGNDYKVNELLKDGYEKLLPHLNSVQELIFTASTFVMLMNGHFVHDWFDPYVKTNPELFAELPLMDRLAIFKAYKGIFQQDEFMTLLNLFPYRHLNTTIMNYYKTNAVREIDEKLATVESYNVYLYKELMLQKLGILKLIEGKEHIKKNKDKYLTLYKELYDKGLRLEAIRVVLILLDECASPYNLQIKTPYHNDWQYYIDLLDNTVPPPPPVLLPDGIHLVYPRVRVNSLQQVNAIYEDIIKEHIDIIIKEVNSWKNHPSKLELCIPIAHLLTCIGRRTEAKEFLSYFDNSGVDPRHFASWIQNEVVALRIELAKDD